ncbi:hypothetical protein ACFQ3S_17415 [Mucilaginibacter terrae]|uniref:hypothetical protein n=1 Tax=Mucilaginibacter terrae TaxID=1955052 RepID=UPI00363872F8
MEEEIDPNEEYIAAYNLGYKLNRISPEIAELLDHIPVQSQKMKALKAGIDQHKDEVLEDYTPDWLQNEDKEINDIDPDKDVDWNIEPDL